MIRARWAERSTSLERLQRGAIEASPRLSCSSARARRPPVGAGRTGQLGLRPAAAAGASRAIDRGGTTELCSTAAGSCPSRGTAQRAPKLWTGAADNVTCGRSRDTDVSTEDGSSRSILMRASYHLPLALIALILLPTSTLARVTFSGADGITSTVMQHGQSSFSGVGRRAR